MRVAWLLAASTALVASVASAEEAPERLTGLAIERIVIEAAPGEDDDVLLQQSGLKVGDAFSPTAVRRAVKLLYKIGRFENVRVRAARVNNRVHLRLILPPRGIVRELRVIASDVLTKPEIEAAIGVATDRQIDPRRLPEMRDALEAVLRERGYRDAAVGMALDEADDSGGLRILVRIDEGPTTLAGEIVVDGEPRMPFWELRRRLGVGKHEVIDLREVRSELKRLEEELRERGYWDVEIGLPTVEPLPATHDGHPLARVVFPIEGGPKVGVSITGNQVIGKRALSKDVAPLEELGTGPSVVAEVKERILRRYERNGFWRARIRDRIWTSEDGENRVVELALNEGPRAAVGELSFPGNTEVKDKVLVQRVREVVARAMAEDLDRPGAYPELVDRLIGGRSLSAPRDSPQPDNTSPDPRRVYIDRAYRTAADSIGDLYRARGYQTVKVENPVVTPRPKTPTTLDVEMRVKPGLRWIVGALSFTGNDAVSSLELIDLSGIEPTVEGGTSVSFDQVEEARRSILAHYKNIGHLYVSVSEALRQVPPRGSLGSFGYTETSTDAPLDVRSVCARAEEAGETVCPIELVFRIEEGPRVTTRDVIVRGVNITQNGVVQSEIIVQDGAVLRERDMVETRDNLLRVGVFDRVTVRPLDAEQVAAEKDVVVEVHERRNNSLDVGVGVSTEEGIRTFASFGDANLGGSALRLQLLGKLNIWIPQLLVLYDGQIRDKIEQFYNNFAVYERVEYEAAAGLSYPRIFGLPPGFTAGLDVISFRDFDPAFAENTQKVTLIGNYKGFRPTIAGGPRPVAIQVRTDFIRANLDCNEDLDRPDLCSTELIDPNRPDRIEGSNIYVTAGPSVSWDLRDEPLNPTAGAYLELETAFAKGLDSNSPDHVSVEGRANFYVPAPYVNGVVFAVSVLGGKIFPLDEGDVPVNRRFFAGGRRTVRGYPEKTLLPQDTPLNDDGTPASTISPGGQLMLALKSELRFALYGPLSMALFYDVGDLWFDGTFAFETEQVVNKDDPTTITRGLANGIGLGIRLATPIGPLSVDLAVPLNRRDPGATDAQLHFAVGTF